MTAPFLLMCNKTSPLFDETEKRKLNPNLRDLTYKSWMFFEIKVYNDSISV